MHNRKTAPIGFYTAKEAIATIGIPPSSFYKLIKAGTLKATMLPGRKEAVYAKQAIDRYARAINAYIEKLSTETSFYVALKEDLPEIRDLIASNGSGVVPPVPENILEAWLRKNPESIHVMRRGSETIGYAAMFPLPLDIIMKRMAGEYMHRAIPIDDIQSYIPGQSIRLYVADAVVKLDENKELRMGVRLVRDIMRFIHRLAEQDIRIIEIYAVGTSVFGIQLCRSLRMEQLDLPTGVSEKRIPFKLDIATSTAPAIVEYRRILEAAQVVRGKTTI